MRREPTETENVQLTSLEKEKLNRRRMQDSYGSLRLAQNVCLLAIQPSQKVKFQQALTQG